MGEEICKDLDPYYQKIRYQVMPIEWYWIDFLPTENKVALTVFHRISTPVDVYIGELFISFHLCQNHSESRQRRDLSQN